MAVEHEASACSEVDVSRFIGEDIFPSSGAKISANAKTLFFGPENRLSNHSDETLSFYCEEGVTTYSLDDLRLVDEAENDIAIEVDQNGKVEILADLVPNTNIRFQIEYLCGENSFEYFHHLRVADADELPSTLGDVVATELSAEYLEGFEDCGVPEDVRAGYILRLNVAKEAEAWFSLMEHRLFIDGEEAGTSKGLSNGFNRFQSCYDESFRGKKETYTVQMESKIFGTESMIQSEEFELTIDCSEEAIASAEPENEGGCNSSGKSRTGGIALLFGFMLLAYRRRTIA